MLEWLRRSMMRWSSRRVTATIQGSTTEHPRVSSARRRHSEEPNRTGGPRSSALEAILAKSILVVVSCNHLSATGLSERTQTLFPDLKACAKSHSAAQQGRWLTGSTTLWLIIITAPTISPISSQDCLLEKAHGNYCLTKFTRSLVDLLFNLNLSMKTIDHLDLGGTMGVGYLGVVFTSV